jgi:transketolase
MHCNRRLCFGHIAEHKKMLSHSITNFSYDVQTTVEQMKEESEKRRNIFNDILTSLNQWRTQQMETVQAIYDEHLKLINSQNEILDNSEKKLFEQLEQNASQPLEQAQKQRHTNMETINHIQQTINKLYEDNAYLKCNLAISPSPMDTPSPSISLTTTTIKKKILPNHNEKGRPLKRLVSKFGNISSIEQSKKDIIVYIYVSHRHSLFNFKSICFNRNWVINFSCPSLSVRI